MACHNDLVKDITARALSTQFDMTLEDERKSLYRILLHNADLSNTVRPYHISHHICSLIATEFRNQAKKEQDNGIPVTSFMILPDDISIAKAEIGFLTYVAKPYFRPQGLCFEGAMTVLAQRLEDNIDRWSERRNELELEIARK